MISYVYCIRNVVNGKCYVGKGNHPKHRFWAHTKCTDYPIGRAIAKHGRKNFEFHVLEECASENDAFQRETWYVDFFDTLVPNGYNLESGGRGGKRRHPLTSQKMSAIQRGRKLSEETKEKIRRSVRENPGIVIFTDEIREKMSRKLRGRKLSQKNKDGIALARKGTSMKEHVRKRVSQSVRKTHLKKVSLRLIHGMFEDVRTRSSIG